MKKNTLVKFSLIASILLVVACKPKINTPSASKGNMDPTRYVSIGNSITSGYADGALYYDGQLNSYPNLIAQQFKLVGGGNFVQPLMPVNSVGVGVDVNDSINSKFVLGYATDCLGATSLMPVAFAPHGDLNALLTSVYAAQGPFNNMGVPGAKSFNVPQVGYGNMSLGLTNPTINPYFGRMASNQVNSSILTDAFAMNPTFFSVFIGNNDVLVYAMAGAASDSITSLPTFQNSIHAIVSTLTAKGAKGIIGTIPDVTSIPFFTTVPWNGLVLRQGQADSLNAVWKNVNGPLYNFKAGSNPFLIKDPSAPLGQRLINEGELVLLSIPLNSLKCKSLGSLLPIPNQYILTATEISKIQLAVSGYNSVIRSIANQYGLALVDVNAFMTQTKTGINYDGISLNASFVTGGAFSLDGIHLNPIGNALLANEFIKAINTQFSSTIPLVDATKYRGILFP